MVLAIVLVAFGSLEFLVFGSYLEEAKTFSGSIMRQFAGSSLGDVDIDVRLVIFFGRRGVSPSVYYLHSLQFCDHVRLPEKDSRTCTAFHYVYRSLGGGGARGESVGNCRGG